MKKRIICAFLFIICAVSVLTLCSCSNSQNDEIAGEWTPSTVSIGGTTIAYSELNTENRGFSFTFNQDGSCRVVIGGVENNGTYTFNKTSVDIQYGGKTQKLSYSEGILTLKLNYNNEVTSYMFTRAAE